MRKLLSSILLLVSFLVIGCDSAGTDSTLSPEESAERISSAVTDLNAEITQIEEGEFYAFMNTFVGGSSFAKTDWGTTLLNELEPMLSMNGDVRFDMDANAGVYTWDVAAGTWERTSGDDFILHFPSSATQQSNDVTFALTEFSDQRVVVEGEAAYLPTRVLADLTYQGTTILRVDLSGVTYGFNGEPAVPAAAHLEVFTHPVTQTFDWSINTSGADFGYELTREEEDVLAVALDAVFTEGAFDGGAFDESAIETASAGLTLAGELELRVDAEVAMLASLNDPAADQVNDLVAAEIYDSGDKIADLRLDPETEQPVVVYLDGTTEPAANFYNTLLAGGSTRLAPASVIASVRHKLGL